MYHKIVNKILGSQTRLLPRQLVSFHIKYRNRKWEKEKTIDLKSLWYIFSIEIPTHIDIRNLRNEKYEKYLGSSYTSTTHFNHIVKVVESFIKIFSM